MVVPVSGGKDSQACLALALEKHNKKDIRAVHQNTGFDHSKTYAHLRYMQRRYGIKIEHTFSSKYDNIFDLIEKDRWFPNGLGRNCTRHLKQRPFKEWLRSNFNLELPSQVHIYMGMRATEGSFRNKKYGGVESDQILSLANISSEYASQEFRHVEVSLPIVGLTTEEVFSYLKTRRDRVNPLYKVGHSRIGCYPCLLTNNKEWALAAKDPEGRAHISRLVQIEDAFAADPNFKRKIIKIHPTRDVRALLANGSITNEDDESTCGWCSI